MVTNVKVSVAHRVGSSSTRRDTGGLVQHQGAGLEEVPRRPGSQQPAGGPCSRVDHLKGRELFVPHGGVTGFCVTGAGLGPTVGFPGQCVGT